MFCPECQSEFTSDVSFCNDCNVSLVETLPELETVSWSPVKEYPGYIPAEMAKAALSDENIPSFIKGDFLSTAYGIKAWKRRAERLFYLYLKNFLKRQLL